MSHTVTIKIEMKNPAILRAAAEALGGQWIGEGTHKLFSTQTATGHGFTLPRWRFPLVAQADGNLAFDDYHGEWGNVADLEKLKTRYAIEAARAEAQNLGWYAEDQADGTLLIYHPDGGTLLVTPAGLDAAGFTGAACSAASEPIARAIGQTTGEARKEEYSAIRQQISER